MESQSNDKPSEETTEVREEEEANTQLEELDSFVFVVFKYWMLVNILWSLEAIYAAMAGTSSEKAEDFGIVYELIHFLRGPPLQIWNIINCLFVFGGMRSKDLTLISKTIDFMKRYVVCWVIIYFFESMSMAMRFSYLRSTVITCLSWGVYYYFTFIYGAKKVRDALKGHQRNRYNL